MRETWEKKVMKFEREIPIGLDARRKKQQGGGAEKAPPPPMGLGLTGPISMIGQMGHRRNLCTHYTLDHTFGEKVYLVNSSIICVHISVLRHS